MEEAKAVERKEIVDIEKIVEEKVGERKMVFDT